MYKQLTKTKRYLILFNVALSVFMATLDGSIVNIALPVISAELSANISSIQWVVTSYLLTISVLLLIWGKISDMYGKKKIFAAGFIIFTIGSVFCGISVNLQWLIFSRVIQAIGASSMMALSQGIVTSVFPPEERGKALGITGTTVALGSLVGPSLGGILVHAMGWQSIFFINIPIGILGTILTFWLIEEDSPEETKEGFDYKGAAMFSSSVILMILGLLLFQEGSIPALLFICMITASVALLVFFIRQEAAVENPLIQLSLFRNSVFSLGLTAAFLIFVATFSALIFLPFYLQNVLKLSTLDAGLLMSFYPIATAVVAPVSGWLSDKISYKPLTITGLAVSTVTLAVMSTLNEASPRLFIILLMIALGVGSAIFQSPNNSSVMGSVPPYQLGVAGGINALFRNLGMVSGITLSVILFTFTTKMDMNSLSGSAAGFNTQTFLKGFRFVLVEAAAVCLLAAAATLVRVIRKPKAG